MKSFCFLLSVLGSRDRKREKKRKKWREKERDKERIWNETNMALLAVELDRAVLEITPHLEHFRSSLLRASNGGLQDPIHTHTYIYVHTGKKWT